MREEPAPPTTGGASGTEPASLLAAAAALDAMADAVRTAHGQPAENDRHTGGAAGPEQALAALLLLRELRTELTGWEAGLIEAARGTGATWADLAHPMGVASRQAAENRYLRLRAGSHTPAAATGAERVKAVRDRRAAERTVTTWARANAADLRVLASRITALTDLLPEALPAQNALHSALGATDAADLIEPLTGIRPHIGPRHPDLAARLAALAQHTDRLRHDSNRRRA